MAKPKKGSQWPLTRFQKVIIVIIGAISVLVYNHLGLGYYLVVLGVVAVGALVIRWIDRNRQNS